MRNQIPYIPQVEVYTPCTSSSHWMDLMLWQKCQVCKREWMPFPKDEHDNDPTDACQFGLCDGSGKVIRETNFGQDEQIVNCPCTPKDYE